MKLTKGEKDIFDSVERGEWKRIPDFKREAVRYEDAARATLRKDKRVNIRMTERDLVHFQKAAVPNPHLEHSAQIHQRATR